MKLRAVGRGSHSEVKLASLVLVVGALAVTGCGGSKSSSSTTSAPASTSTQTSSSGSSATSSGQSLALESNPEGQLQYNTTALSAKAGSVAIKFTNSAPLGHNVTIESASGATVGATPTFQGGSKTLTLSLKPGTYKFYCSVPGHRQAGMEGTLTVK
jgi:plastocyanin